MLIAPPHHAYRACDGNNRDTGTQGGKKAREGTQVQYNRVVRARTPTECRGSHAILLAARQCPHMVIKGI